MLLFIVLLAVLVFLFFFFNDTATTEIYTLSLHDALPISTGGVSSVQVLYYLAIKAARHEIIIDRKSTRLNSSHLVISYAVFCLKKKNKSLRRVLLSHPYASCAATDAPR